MIAFITFLDWIGDRAIHNWIGHWLGMGGFGLVVCLLYMKEKMGWLEIEKINYKKINHKFGKLWRNDARKRESVAKNEERQMRDRASGGHHHHHHGWLHSIHSIEAAVAPASLLVGPRLCPSVVLDHVDQLDDVLALLVLLAAFVGMFLQMNNKRGFL